MNESLLKRRRAALAPAYELFYEEPLHLVRGEGVYLFDDQGRRYLDGCGCTAAVTHIGHGDAAIADALAEQARTLAVHPTHVFHSPVVEQYFERLCAFAPEGFTRAWTISGGTEAIENSIKLAFQYHKAKGRKGRLRVIGRWSSYHGNSITALDVGGMVPGSYSGLSTNIYQEGVRIPPIKLYERGKVNRAAMTLLMANMRLPEEREGDLVPVGVVGGRDLLALAIRLEDPLPVRGEGTLVDHRLSGLPRRVCYPAGIGRPCG